MAAEHPMLSEHALTPRLIIGWQSFLRGKQRSAVISALHAVQHDNHGYLTEELMQAVAEYLDMPAIQVYEVAAFYSMFEAKPVGRCSISVCTNMRACCAAPMRFYSTLKTALVLKRVRVPRMESSIFGAKRNALPHATMHRC